MDQKTLSKSRTSDDNKFPWSEIADFVSRNIFWISAGGLLGLLIGVGVALITPKEWEASSMLQVGQIEYSPGGTPTVIEPIAQVIARVQSQSFEDSVLQSQGQDPADESAPLVRLIRKNLTVWNAPNTNLINLSVRGFSPEQSKDIAKTVQNMLFKAHADVVNAFLSTTRARLARVDQDLLENESRAKKLHASTTPSGKNGVAVGSQDVMLVGLLEKNSQEKISLLNMRDSLEQQLDSSRTFPSKPIGDINVARREVFPSQVTFGIIGLLAGVLVGVGIGAIRHFHAVTKRR